MPLKTSKAKTEKGINKIVAFNIRELEVANKKRAKNKKRTQKQIIAIAETVARGRNKRKSLKNAVSRKTKNKNK